MTNTAITTRADELTITADSDHTRRAYRGDLARFAAWRGDRPITPALVAEYRAHLLTEGKSVATVNRAMAAIRSQARAAEIALRVASDDPLALAQALQQVKNTRGESAPAGRHIRAGELAALIRVCADDPTPAGARDAALLALTYTLGARRGEIAALSLADVDQDGQGYKVTLHGKGNKQRTVYADSAAAVLSDWLAVRGDAPGALFPPIEKGGKRIYHERHMTTDAIAKMLARRAALAGVTNIRMHDLRRTAVGDMLAAGEDLSTVQKTVGHSSPAMTARYDRRGGEAVRRAQSKLHIAYSPRKR